MGYFNLQSVFKNYQDCYQIKNKQIISFSQDAHNPGLVPN